MVVRSRSCPWHSFPLFGPVTTVLNSEMTYSFIVNRTSLYLLRETKSETSISNWGLVFLFLYQHNCYTLSLNDGSLVPVFVHQSYPSY